MKQRIDFLKHFNISLEDFEATGLNWENLLKIKDDYETFEKELSVPINSLFESLRQAKAVHSVRFRTKKPNRLIAKIIRKKIKEPDRIIDVHSYRTEITDLIGLRALHLFKEDWLTIHNFIKEKFTLKGDPIAYYRSGDSSEHIDEYKKYGCEAKEHFFGYRSVHYLVETKVDKATYISEIQVRTIFEEGWSEIDHKIRYPSNSNRLLNQFLVTFNRLSGNADEMGSYVKYLKKELERQEEEYTAAMDKKTALIGDIKAKVNALGLNHQVEASLEKDLDEILNLLPRSFNDFKLNPSILPGSS